MGVIRSPEMTSVRRGVLEGRASAVVVFMLFSCLGAWSWASISNHHCSRDPIYLGGLAFAIIITSSVAYRSPSQSIGSLLVPLQVLLCSPSLQQWCL